MKNQNEIDEIIGRLGALELLAIQSLTIQLMGIENVQGVADELVGQFPAYSRCITSTSQRVHARLRHESFIKLAVDNANAIRPAAEQKPSKTWLQRKIAAMHPETLTKKLRCGIIAGRRKVGRWRIRGAELLKLAR